jgi:hypothetical protein
MPVISSRFPYFSMERVMTHRKEREEFGFTLGDALPMAAKAVSRRYRVYVLRRNRFRRHGKK